MAATTVVSTLLDRFRRSAAGPIFFRMSLSIVTVVPAELGVQILFGMYFLLYPGRGWERSLTALQVGSYKEVLQPDQEGPEDVLLVFVCYMSVYNINHFINMKFVSN